MSNVQSPAPSHWIRWGRLALASLIAVFLLWVAFLPAPPLPHAVHDVLHAVLGHHAEGSRSSPAWLATFLRKAPEALLYFLIALLLYPSRPWRIWTFVGVSAYGLALELLRPLHGRAFEGLDVGYEAIAACIGAYVPALFARRTVTASDRPT